MNQMSGGVHRPLICQLLAFAMASMCFLASAHYRENPDEGTRPPQILREPDFTEISIGGSGALHVHAIGAGTLEYHWYHNGEAVAGANGPSFEIADATARDAGFYFVAISSEFGSSRSSMVRVRVDRPENLVLNERHLTGTQSSKTVLEFFDGHFVAGGNDGSLARSDKGFVWETITPLPERDPIRDLVSGNDRLIATLEDGRIALTRDLSDWEYGAISEQVTKVERIVYALNRFTALVRSGDQARLFTSIDGLNWERQHEFEAVSGNDFLFFTESLIVAFRSNSESTEFSTSVDGVTWVNSVDTSIVGIEMGVGLGQSILIGNESESFSTTNGTVWQEGQRIEFPTPEKVVETAGKFYGLTGGGGLIEISGPADWSVVFNAFSPHKFESPFAGLNPTIEFGNGIFVYGPVEGSIYPIADFENFEPLKRNDTRFSGHHSVTGLKYLNDRFLLSDFRGRLLVSDTGVGWKLVEDGKSKLGSKDIVYGNGIYLSDMATGTGFSTLIPLPHDFQSSFFRLAFGNGMFVGTDREGIYYSENGVQWNYAMDLHGVFELVFEAGRFLAIGEGDLVAISNNGVQWNTLEVDDPKTGLPYYIEHLVYGDGKYIASARNYGKIVLIESEDGNYWNEMDIDFPSATSVSGLFSVLLDLAFGDGRFLFMFEDRFVETSDFETWTVVDFNASGLIDLEFGNGTFVAVGREGRIVQYGTAAAVPPSVSFRNQSRVFTNPTSTMELLVDAFDTDGRVIKVEFFENGKLTRTVPSPPYDWEWTAPKNGIFSLSAVAYDDSGRIGDDAITVSVAQNIAIDQIQPSQFVGALDTTYFEDSTYALASDGTVFRSDDLSDWDMVFTPVFSIPYALDTSSGFLYAPTNGGFYVSENGTQWTYTSLPEKHPSTTYPKPFFYKKIRDWFVYDRYRSRDLFNWIFMPEHSLDLFGSFGDQLFASNAALPPIPLWGTWGDQQFLQLPSSGSLCHASQIGEHFFLGIDPMDSLEPVEFYTSTDGVAWSPVAIPEMNILRRFEKVGDLYFITGTINGSEERQFVSSDELQSWVEGAPVDSAVRYNDGYVGILDSVLAYSNDGVNWTENAAGIRANGDITVTHVGLLAGERGGDLYKSSDGVNWEVANGLGTRFELLDIAANGSKSIFVATTNSHILYSSDGLDWEFRAKPENMGDHVAFGKDQFVITGPTGTVYVSSDGLSWSEKSVHPDATLLSGIEYLPDIEKFIVSTSFAPRADTVWLSSNGIDWTSARTGGPNIDQLKTEGDFVFARTIGSSIYRTKDGLNWTEVPGIWDAFTYRSIYFENGVYITQHSNINTIYRSTNAIDWHSLEAPFERFRLIRPTESGFYAISTTLLGTDLYSEDGLTWTSNEVTNHANLGIVLKQAKPIELGGERYYLGRSLYKTSSVDLSLRRALEKAPISIEGNRLSLNLIATNEGSDPVNLNGVRIDAYLGSNDVWNSRESNHLQSFTLDGVELEAQVSQPIALAIELPENSIGGEASVHIVLNRDQQIREIDVSNNYAWVRLLPNPQVSIRNSNNNSVQVEWSREGGYVKRVEYSRDLKNWFLLDAPPVDAESGAMSKTLDTERNQYFRIKAE